MTDIVLEIRAHLASMAPHQRDRLTARQMRAAADEIDRLRLTDAEREAVRFFSQIDNGPHGQAMAGLLARLGGAT
jgi:hypothetical protein